MQTAKSRGLTRAALTAAGVAALSFALPATASAAPGDLQSPTIEASVAGNKLNLTVTNPNQGMIDPSCGVYVLDAAKLPGVLADPTSILTPGVVVWGTILPTDRVFANAAGTASRSYVTTDLADGAYAVIGECTKVFPPEGPETGTPQIIFVGGPLGGIGTGSLGDMFGS